MSLIRKIFSKNLLLLSTLLLSSTLLVNTFIHDSNTTTEVNAQSQYINSDYFIDYRRSARIDYENISNQNWMGFVSGDRTLNTINIPGSHDTGMKRIFAFRDGLISFNRKAITQGLFIDDQLNAGVRYLDLRLNNFIKDTSTGDWKPSHNNCSIAHGKSSIGGTYYAGKRGGTQLTLKDIIGYLRDFLTANPTETVIVSYQPETQDSFYHHNIYATAYWNFYELFREKNPSTGRSFVYMPGGKFGQELNYFPKLYECRGQIVLICDAPKSDKYARFPGGFRADGWFGDHKLNPAGSYEDSVSGKKEHVRTFYQENVKYLYDTVDQSDDYCYGVGLNTTDPNFFKIPGEPLDIADEINAYFFEEYAESPFLEPNRRLGWITMDGVDAELCNIIFRTNMCDSVRANMKTIQVKSGLDSATYPDQIYRLQVGAVVELPKNIYDYNQRSHNNYFDGYFVNEQYYFADRSFTVIEDAIVSTQWTSEPRSSIQVIWQDCDNGHGIRLCPMGSYQEYDTLKVKIFPSERVVDIYPEEDFFCAIYDEFITDIVPVWDRVVITEENPYGVDRINQYRYEVEENPHGGLILRLIHTVGSTFSQEVNVIWEDGDDQLRLRPDSVNVRVFEEGNYLYDVNINKEEEWKKYLRELTRAEDGLFVDHHLEIEEVEGYEAIIDGWTITMYVSLGLLTQEGSLIFIDNDESLRPESVMIDLYHLDEYIESKEFAALEEDKTTYPWYFPVEACYLLETYRTQVQEIENYSIIHTSPSLHHYAVLNSLIDHDFVITKINEIGTVEFFNTDLKERLDLARGLYDLLSEEEQALVENYAILTNAETTYASMDALYQLALPVIQEIRTMHKIGTYYWFGEVTDAMTHYNELPDEAKPYVTNYARLDEEYALYCAMGEVELFTAAFILTDSEDTNDTVDPDLIGTCVYTMQRWSKLAVMYTEMSALAKSIMRLDYEYPDYLEYTFLEETFIRYDLIITTYGTDLYPDFMHRFDGPVVGSANQASIMKGSLVTKENTIFIIASIVGVCIAVTSLIFIKKEEEIK